MTILYFCEKQNTKEENAKIESHTLEYTDATEEWLVGNYTAPQIEFVNKLRLEEILESKLRHELNQECHEEQSKKNSQKEYMKFQERCKKQSEEYDKRRKKEREEDEERRKKDEERRRKHRRQLL